MRFITPLQAVNKAYLKLPVAQADIDKFKKNYASMRLAEKKSESEEYYKNLLTSLLTQTWYGTDYPINTYGRCDAVIYNGNTNDSKPAVIIEMKSPTNSSEMVTMNNMNKKAWRELLFYFLREYYTNENHELKYLIISNYNEWFTFNARDFVGFVQTNKQLLKDYEKFVGGQFTDDRTSYFYNQIAPRYYPRFEAQNIDIIHFSIQDVENTFKPGNEKKLIALYKILSPQTLLNKPFTNDNNSLDKTFYAELLHIIGLEEIKDGNKKLIHRKNESKRDDASLLEACMRRLSMDMDNENEQFEIALRLTLTWINRLLFLKLLEAQQLSYNHGAQEYRILDTRFIHNFDELNDLFFHGLAKKPCERHPKFKDKYRYIPYLNSSLFEKSDDEERYSDISAISSEPIQLFAKTVLKDEKGKKLTGCLPILDYLFRFLDAYNFSSEGETKVQAESKTLINASVLGLIFEKINGYKDGSFFTPGFITQYMAHEAITRAVVTKFNKAKKWKCKSIQDIKNKDYDYDEANRILNSLRICDPAVGSGHFLVSCLNEMVAIKSELGCLFATDGTRIKPSEWELRVESDELVVYDAEGSLYQYNKDNSESRRVQEALFNAKRDIIENCLFGVDINPNSVNICMLRLWIELLKHAYYIKESNYTDLETLPNIDINIKCGNSLISRYQVEVGKSILKDSSLTPDIRKLIRAYRENVRNYKRTSQKADKRAIRKTIAEIKSRIFAPVQLKLDFAQTGDIGKQSGIYKNSMEWMIEFPEVLDDNAKFLGFDVVIANPPYGLYNKKQNQKVGLSTESEILEYIRKIYPDVSEGMINASKVFYDFGFNIMSKNGYINMIIPFGILTDQSSVRMRKKLLYKYNIISIDAFPERDCVNRRIFEEAKMSTCIILCNLSSVSNQFQIGVSYDREIQPTPILFYKKEIETYSRDLRQIPLCKRSAFKIITEIRRRVTKTFKDYCPSNTGEIDMTFGKSALTTDISQIPLIKGVQIAKWYVRQTNEEISQGIIEYIDSATIQKVCSVNKLSDAQNARLVYQGLTGINEIVRIRATYIPSGYCLANSCGYIRCNNCMSYQYVLALLNSKLLNFIFKSYSTNSNVNGYEIDQLPFVPLNINNQQKYIDIVDEILHTKNISHQSDVSILEKKLDQLVYKLYGLSDEEIEIIEES